MKFFFWITIVVVGLLIDVVLKAGLDLLFVAPPPGGSFLRWSWRHSEICSNECVTQRTLSAIFWKIFTHTFEGKGWCGSPQFFYDINLIKKWKKWNFSTIRGEQGGKRWTDTTQCIFCIRIAYLLVSELFFNLGINNKFVIANSFYCNFTSDRGIIFDLRRYVFVCFLSWSGGLMPHSRVVTTTGLRHMTWTQKNSMLTTDKSFLEFSDICAYCVDMLSTCLQYFQWSHQTQMVRNWRIWKKMWLSRKMTW